MVALSPVSHRSSTLAGAAAASPPEGDGGFAHALALLTGDDGATSPPAQRQGDADPGKTLPADPAAPATLDPRLLWLPVALLPTTPAPALAKPAPPAVAVAAPGDPLALATPQEMASASDTAELLDLFHAAEPATAQPQPAAPGTDAIRADLAALGLAPAARDDRKRGTDDPVFQPMTMTTNVALQNAVQPTADTRHVPLDLRGDAGLQKMIDHIELLRDDADAHDTRIRLVPDALGAVDVAVRRQGDSLHVHFTAETAATRALLTEAQPRLVELADARGVRIAGASVDGGSGGSGQHAPPHRQPPAAANTLPVSTPIDATGDDARLA